MRNIFEKFGREGKNPGGGLHQPPLGRPKVDFYLGHLRVNNLLKNVYFDRYYRFYWTFKISAKIVTNSGVLYNGGEGG